MPRCGCAGSSCTCLVIGGEGVTVEGAGTADNPYVIAIDAADISGTIQFIDSPSVDFTITGSGTEANPYQVRADATLAVTELTDVDCTTPADGSTLVWDDGAGAWVCGLPPTALGDLTDVVLEEPVPDNYVLAWNGEVWTAVPPNTVDPGAIATGTSLTGDGQAASPLEVHTPAAWGTGELADLLATSSQTQDDGLPVYKDSTGALRTPRGVVLEIPADRTQPSEAAFNNGRIKLGHPDESAESALEIYRTPTGGLPVEARVYISGFATPEAGLQVKDMSGGDPATADQGTITIKADGQAGVVTREDGANAVRPIAFGMATGVVVFANVPANDDVGINITFPNRRFTDIPVVVGTVHSSVPRARGVGTAAITRTGFRLVAGNAGTQAVTNMYVDWQATQLESAPLFGRVSEPLDPPVQPVVVTCHTVGCENADIPIELDMGWIDDDGEEHTDEKVVCGACGLEITDIVEVS